MDTENTNQPTEVQPKQSNKTLVATAIFVILAILAFVTNGSKNKSIRMDDKQTLSNPIITPTTSMEKVEESMMINDVADGTYEAVGNYVSPGGDEEIDVSITVKDGLIEEAEVMPKATRPNSVKFQNIFKENFKNQVIGKKISEVKLDKVSGSSLTPKGFMDALQKISNQNS